MSAGIALKQHLSVLTCGIIIQVSKEGISFLAKDILKRTDEPRRTV